MGVSILRVTAALSILYILSSTPPACASEITISSGATDSAVCAIIEREHAHGIDLWRAKDMTGALERFKACESALQKRSLWMSSILPNRPTADQMRAYKATNSVIFSLASIYQQMHRRTESERYAQMARERGLLPKVFMAGRTPP